MGGAGAAGQSGRVRVHRENPRGVWCGGTQGACARRATRVAGGGGGSNCPTAMAMGTAAGASRPAQQQLQRQAALPALAACLHHDCIHELLLRDHPDLAVALREGHAQQRVAVGLQVGAQAGRGGGRA